MKDTKTDTLTVQVWRSEDDTHWTVQVDTGDDTGQVAVEVNDGRFYYGNPDPRRLLGRGHV